MLSPDRLDLVPFKRFAAFATLDDETAEKFNYLLAAITADPKMRDASATIAALNGFMRAHPVQKDTNLDPTDHFLDEVELYKGFTKALKDTERRKYNSLLSKARSAMRKDEKTKAYGLLVQLAQLLCIEPSSDGAESFGQPVGVKVFLKKPDPELNPDTKAILKALDGIHARIGALEKDLRSGGDPTETPDNISYWEARRLMRHANMAMRYDQKKIEFANQVKNAQQAAAAADKLAILPLNAEEQKIVDTILTAGDDDRYDVIDTLLQLLEKRGLTAAYRILPSLECKTHHYHSLVVKPESDGLALHFDTLDEREVRSADRIPSLLLSADMQKLVDKLLESGGGDAASELVLRKEFADRKISTPMRLKGSIELKPGRYNSVLVTGTPDRLGVHLEHHEDSLDRANKALELQDQAIAREMASVDKFIEGIEQAIKVTDQHCATVDKNLIAIDKALLKAEQKRTASRGFWRTMATPFTWVASKFRKDASPNA